ncbi:hypothetical protein Rhal01_02608 [Rubritalea halochordaticola]|uniref:Uncharacterized protein n=2 Tax=Rubritalea halochordaticola TaxID=714537 RepID=A0ABP9V1D3_9BACT
MNVGFADEEKLADPIDNKYVDMIAAEKIEEADAKWLEKSLAAGGIDECIAVALLFRTDPERYSDELRKYFHLEKVDKPIVLTEEEVNKEVNQVIQKYRGRKPAEIAARIYLSFRGSNKVITRGDFHIYLEMVFRAAVFSGTIKPTEKDLMKISAFVDSPTKDSHNQEQENR